MQSFLGSLNHYSRFIEDFDIQVLVLYELRGGDFHETRRSHEMANDCSSRYDYARDTHIDDERGQRPTGDHHHQLVTVNGQDHF